MIPPGERFMHDNDPVSLNDSFSFDQILSQGVTTNRSMASSPSSSHSASASCSRSCKYDVFLSFRGEDTRKTFVDHLHSALKQHLIEIYKDDEALPRGDSIRPSLFKSIEESRIAIIIFSENYADSSWCLDELANIMKCRDERGQIVIPIFYGVDPSEVRNQKRKFGEAFAIQEAQNVTKAELWRKALVDASNIAGWEPKHIANGNESKVIKEIVDTILDRLCPLSSNVDEDLVGMTTRILDLKSRLEIGSGGVRMVGIWGVGGGGKTTLASSLYMEISQHFQGHCIVENVREETSKHGLNKLQENILSALFKSEVKVQSVVEGKHMMKSMLCRRKVLVLLDDVDKLVQLEALAGKHNWFGSGSRIIITTRDQHLLRTHKVDHVYPIRLLSNDEAIQLFKRHAYNEQDPVADYETLSSHVISYASGLPLALRVIGSFLYDKNKNEWISALDKLKDIPDLEVMDILKISYDGLETYQKELFLDIACFWRFRRPDDAMEILEACGYHPEIGIKVLRQKALITIVDKDWYGNVFDMHDLVEEMGHYIVRGEHPKNPKEHSRVWKHEEIKEMCFRDATMENDKTEAITADVHDLSSRFCKVVSNMKKLRWLEVTMDDDDKGDRGPTFLSNELQYIDWVGYPATGPFPYNFQPTKLVVLKLSNSKQKELWEGCKHLPQLKVLQLNNMEKLLSTPDFHGLPRLQKLTLESCDELEEIHPSFGNHTSLEYLNVSCCPKLRMFPTIVHMGNLKTLQITDSNLEDGEIPSGIGELSNLEELNLSRNYFSLLDFSFTQLTRLKVLKLFSCNKLIELPELPSSLVILKASYCNSLTTIGDFQRNCKCLCIVSLLGTRIVNDGWRLLQSMLKGKAIENGSMLLLLPGLEIPMGFTTPLLRGSRYTLQLPERWCDDFSGFLMCAVSKYYFLSRDFLKISVKQELSGMDSKDDVVWEESDGDENTLVWYVSFGSLRHTAWWDQTYKALSFENADDRCSGFGVRLVAKKSRSGLTETSTTNSSVDYTPDIKIEHDKVFAAITISSDAYTVY
ncbi:hypothetical protein L1987_47864 [Smallanthus sonchifolius]|uniref:Uncharacterized protein n=1 Tax=Smallanthus sonchifolius TaxID=185202 RepID=A0ACB9FPZ3_9ASTR|nr:hypothetical protein L1987_47864 [Smallanthus sonchifolius]